MKGRETEENDDKKRMKSKRNRKKLYGRNEKAEKIEENDHKKGMKRKINRRKRTRNISHRMHVSTLQVII
jgi:hypothetical protein